MEFGEQLFLSHEEFVQRFGEDLAIRDWSVDVASTQLAVTLSSIQAHADLIADDLNELVEQSGNTPLEQGSSEFTTIIRLVTRGIAYRDDFDEEPELDSPPTLPPGFTAEQAISGSTEGIFWIDPEQEQWRKKMIAQDAQLLKAFSSGLVTGGYPEKDVKDAMREELDSVLDYLITRTSYAAVYQIPIIVSIMRSANLTNHSTWLRWVRRFGRAIKAARS